MNTPKYLVFGWGTRTYDEEGGWQDCIDLSDSYEEAYDSLHSTISDNVETSGELLYGQIVDFNTRRIIYTWSLFSGEHKYDRH